MRAGGVPVEEGSSKIRLQDMTMPFDLEITVVAGDERHSLDVTFTFECENMDKEPRTEFVLAVHGQRDAT